jgi:hypothetical protein
LWHWPVFVFLRPGEELSDSLAVGVFSRLALTLVLAEMSFRLIEEPLRKDRIDNRLYANIGYGVIFCITISSITSLFLPDIYQNTEFRSVVTENSARSSAIVDSIKLHSPEAKESNEGTSVQPAEVAPLQAPQDNPLPGCITAFGDSVMLGAKGELEKAVPCVMVNATVGRQGSDLLKTVQHLRSTSRMGEVLVIHIGTNGYIYESNLRGILEAIPKDAVVALINIHANRRWTADNNLLIEKVNADHPQVNLIDWERESRSHPEYFVKDGVHLTVKGINAYVRLIKDSLTMILSHKATPPISTRVEKLPNVEIETGEFSQFAPEVQHDTKTKPSFDL